MSAKDRLQTLDHALSLLEALAAAKELGVSDLSRRLDLPTTIVHRTLATFEARGYLRQNPVSRKYMLTPRFWELGRLAVSRLDLHDLAKQMLDHLVAQTGETAYLSVLHGLEALYIAKSEGSEPLRLYVDIGGHGPAYCTATGKVHLAYAAPAVIEELFMRRLVKLTRRTITTRTAFLKELERIRRREVSLNLGERRDDIGAVAAPVFDREGRCAAAIGISGPLPRFSRTRLPALIRAVKAAASKISQQAGYVPHDRSNARTSGRTGSRSPGGAPTLTSPRSTGSFSRTSHAS